MPVSRVTVGEEIPDDALRDIVGRVGSGAISAEKGRFLLERHRTSAPAPDFRVQFADLVDSFSRRVVELVGTSDTAHMGWCRSQVLGDLGLLSECEGSHPVEGEPSADRIRSVPDPVPGWRDLANVYIRSNAHLRVYDDPRIEAMVNAWRVAVGNGDMTYRELDERTASLLAASREDSVESSIALDPDGMWLPPQARRMIGVPVDHRVDALDVECVVNGSTVEIEAHVYVSGELRVDVTADVDGHVVTLSGPPRVVRDGRFKGQVDRVADGVHNVVVVANGVLAATRRVVVRH